LYKERLRQREEQLLEAQELASTGSFVWNLQTNCSEVTPQLLKILDLTHADDFDGYMQHIHPEDRPKVQAAIDKAVNGDGIYDCEYRYQTRGTQKRIWSHGVVTFHQGIPMQMKGTVTDVTERHRLVHGLKENETLYKQAEALTHIGNWSWEIDKNYIVWSDEMYRIYGLEPQSEVVTFERFIAFVHPEDRERVVAEVQSSLQTHLPNDFYHRIVLADGTEKVMHAKGNVTLDSSGKPCRMMGTGQDVTERHRIEQQLRENQTFIQKVADATPSIIATYNVNTGRYRFVSGGLQTLLGYDPSDPLTKGIDFFVGIVHPDDLNIIMRDNAAALQRANETGDNDEVVEFTYRMRHKNGYYRWFHTYGTVFDRNANGLVEHVLNISLDVTDRLQAEKRVLERESFIEHVADASPTVLYLFDLKESRVTYANKEIKEALGYEPEEVIAMGNLFTPSIYHPEDITKSPEEYGGYKSNFGQQPIMEYECRMKHKYDNWRWMLVREMIYQRDSSGVPTSVLGAALDITDRKEMEDTLMRRTTELQQTNANLAEFAYVASHDLKEPLRKIQVFADRIAAKEADRLSENGKDWFKRMQSAATRMDDLIDDLLSFSRTNTAEKQSEAVDLNKLLALVKSDLSEPIEKAHAVVTARNLPTVRGIEIQLRQLFQNLLSNAIKFRKQNTTPLVTIEADVVQGSELIDFNAEKNKRYHKLTFRDNGIGFEPEYAEKIFGLFQRLHGKTEFPGTGIGLALCKKVVENHNGFIHADSKLGDGATFTVYLPAS
jgi:PAS domain S-box-containing protein